MMSKIKAIINNDWLYTSEGKTQKVHLPHTSKEVSYNYFDEKSYQFIADYEKNLYVSKDAKRVFLEFEGVMTAFELWVNEQKVGDFRGGYISHVAELTDCVKRGEENKILVKVDSTERRDVPPFGHVIDYLTFGGIYRDVVYYEKEWCMIENVFYKYEVVHLENGKGNIVLTPQVFLDNRAEEGSYTLLLEVAGQVIENSVEVTKGKSTYVLDKIVLESINLWGIENPVLYKAKMVLLKDYQKLDDFERKLGFRKLHIDHTGVYLNEEKVKIRGLNRHQSFPYVGYAMPKRAQQKDADILKDELGLNCVRSSHYPPSTYFLDRCDEVGLLVLEEIPGWQHVSQDEAWRNQALADVKGMITRDFNHPSVMTWGVRINESGDDEALYTKTNKLARELDDTRLTSGIRCYEKSQLLEDIYTMNDFIHGREKQILRPQQQVTGLDHKVPYLVTEFCGHIFPTKRFDNESRLVEHALRHGRVQSEASRNDDYLGAIGWCAFDYNTHYDFGSGDRICYHGVMDMYRMPKFAAHLYRSQKDPSEEIVLEPLTYWSMGENNIATVFPVQVCTNCDEVEVIIGGESKGIFTREGKGAEENLKGLTYAPIRIDALSGDWGSKWSDITFKGIIGGKVVKENTFSAHPTYTDLEVKQDDEILLNDQFDVTRITVKAVDECGHLLPYIQDAFTIEVEGNIEVIGKTLLPLTGGCMAFWVKTKGNRQQGKATVTVRNSFNMSKTLEISLNVSP